jgi:nicotinamidase-related amidase
MATAFIGLDFINDIVHPEGKISHTANLAAERGVIEKVNRALATARERGWLTILVKVGFAKGYTDQPKHSPFFGRLHEISALEAEFQVWTRCRSGDCETAHRRLLWHTTGCGIASVQG